MSYSSKRTSGERRERIGLEGTKQVSLLLSPLDSHVLLGQDKKKSPRIIAHLESENSDSECLYYLQKRHTS